MKNLFCAECGKQDVPLVDNFCEQCYWKYKSIISTKNARLEVPYCLTCLAVKLPNGWSRGNEQDEVTTAVAYGFLRNINTNPEIDVSINQISEPTWVLPNPEFIVTYLGISYELEDFDPHTEEIDVEYKLIGGICKTCIKRKTGSHDVTVQIRAKERKLHKSEIDKITKMLFSMANELFEESNDSYVSDIIENHGGIDIYLGSNALAEEFIILMKKLWVGHYEKNYKLITEEKDNTRVYRITHLYRLPHVSGGELVIHNNELCRVHSITANSLKLQLLTSYQYVYVSNWEEVQFPNPHPYTVKKIVISEGASDSYLFMDSSTFETIEVGKGSFSEELTIGEEYEFLFWDNTYYLDQVRR
ncbi:MAG: hypothetical protein INQ03_05985 [Candidatus Heimdallarchaeota archaeon]|nr:hypothetical protein [Candidatus Heimdallarchaeota archaeon]